MRMKLKLGFESLNDGIHDQVHCHSAIANPLRLSWRPIIKVFLKESLSFIILTFLALSSFVRREL